ncbi:MAG: Rieske (2Fe-2S) protein [Casimicrobiaceae bacterium]
MEYRLTEHFIKVARVDELPPGKMRRIALGERRILLANIGGRYYAADDTCTHEDASLSAGCLDGEWVKCPLHGSRFNVRTGEVVDEPAEVGLRTYPVRIDGNDIWIVAA